jgi:Zn-dependent M28 family amino/carboxypeptidase
MSQAGFPATIVFAVVSGEEQGLLGAEHLAEQYVKQKVNLEALLNNDIMGSNHSNETNIRDNTRLRVFSEGLPGNLMKDTTGRIAQIRQFGNENDGKARTLARYVKEIGERYVDNLDVVLILPQRSLPAWWRPYALCAARLCGRSSNRDERKLRSPAPGPSYRRGYGVWRSREVHGL